ncbi:hypothetical protein C8F01DRAFT_1302670 [Mycena amicta]|nr:hypothetical protein C8F01DRAFT_1302670 [Mycena amicta]
MAHSGYNEWSVKRLWSFLLLAAPALAGTLLDIRSVQTQARCEPTFDWADNSIGATPCLLAAYVWGACFTGTWDVPALTEGNQYTNPNATTANLCTCSWAAYNLLSACTSCQGIDSGVQTWAGYTTDCQNYLTNVYFPSNIELPANILIPYWAGTNASTWDSGKFNVPQAQLVAGLRQYTPPRLVFSLTFPQINPTTLLPASLPPAPSTKSKTPIGPIVGGVIGGVCVLLIGGLIAFCYMRRSSHQGHKRAASGAASSIRTYMSRPTLHRRSMSEVSAKSILSSPHGHGNGNGNGATMSILSPSSGGHRPGTIYTTGTLHTRTGSAQSLVYGSGNGSPQHSPAAHQLQFAVNREEIINPFPLALPSNATPRHKGSESTLGTIYQSQEGGSASGSGSTATPGTPSVVMTSYMDAVPEHAHEETATAIMEARAREAQEIELDRLQNNTSPPAYTPYASPSPSPEPQPAEQGRLLGHGKRGRGQPSVDSSRSYDSISSYGQEGSISAIDDVIGRMGLVGTVSSTGAPTTVATGQSVDVVPQTRHKPSVSNP